MKGAIKVAYQMKSSMFFENRSIKRLILFSIANNKKPKIEPKINRGTDRVFRQVEADSRELDEADDTASERAYDSTE